MVIMEVEVEGRQRRCPRRRQRQTVQQPDTGERLAHVSSVPGEDRRGQHSTLGYFHSLDCAGGDRRDGDV